MESFSGNLPFESRDIQTDHDIEKNITQSFNKLGKRRHIRSCSRVSNENSSVGNGILDVHMIICPGLFQMRTQNGLFKNRHHEKGKSTCTRTWVSDL